MAHLFRMTKGVGWTGKRNHSGLPLRREEFVMARSIIHPGEHLAEAMQLDKGLSRTEWNSL
jgi:hypothetical protein